MNPKIDNFEIAYRPSIPVGLGIAGAVAVPGAVWAALQMGGVPGSRRVVILIAALCVAVGTFLVLAVDNFRLRRRSEAPKPSTSNDPSKTLVLPVMRLTDQEFLCSHLPEVRVIRLFASGSETVRTALDAILGDVSRTGPLRIKVLVRISTETGRIEKIKEAAAKWRQLDDKFGVTTEVRVYSFERMCRGLLLDDKFALLGMYRRVGGQTLGQSDPAYLIDGRTAEGKRLIDFTLEQFDRVFDIAPTP